MDLENVRTKAIALDLLLNKLKLTDADVEGLSRALDGVLRDAINGNISRPLEWRDIPGGYDFLEGPLRKYPDLESAFAKFRLAVTDIEIDL